MNIVDIGFLVLAVVIGIPLILVWLLLTLTCWQVLRDLWSDLWK